MKLPKDWMTANVAEPVLGVAVVGLAAVQNAMPETAGGAVDFLADGMRLVEEIVTEPETG